MKFDYNEIMRLKDYDRAPTIANILEYYKKYGDEIIEYGNKRPLNFFCDYPFDWSLIMTPIEFDAWSIIRCIGKIVMYPQYPVLKYRPDFANPTKKIILECDGKDFHDAKKDKIRDSVLLADGWKVFRVTGSELYKTTEIEWDDYNDCYDFGSLKEHYLNTAEGVIKAIRCIYFTGGSFDASIPDVYNLMYETLDKHRLVDFEIPMIERKY